MFCYGLAMNAESRLSEHQTESETVSAANRALFVLANVGLATLYIAALWRSVAGDELLMWWAALAVLAGFEALASTRTNASTPRPRLLVSALIGGLWLVAAVAFFPQPRPELLSLQLFFLSTAAVAAAIMPSRSMLVSTLRIGLALPVTAGLMLVQAGADAWPESLLVVAMYAAVTWLASRIRGARVAQARLLANRNALLREVASSARELEERRELEARLRLDAERANLAKSRFLAHSSHDLRQPLHATGLLLEAIDEAELSRDNRHAVARVRQSVQVLAKLFDSLLDLTQLDTGQIEIHRRTVDLGAVMDEVVADFSELAAVNKVSLTAGRDAPGVSADITVIRRILQNLVANAIRHAPGGHVHLDTSERDGVVHLTVRDDGAGIAPEDQARIFDEFTRLEPDSAATGAGRLGLGLSIVSRLAQLIDASVRVDSTLGQGSCFDVGPFVAAPKSAQRASADRAASSAHERVRVLVVDDDEDTLRATAGLLEKWGMQAELSLDAFPEITHRPNLVVCDYELNEGHTGIDAIAHLRQRFGRDLPALLVSGNTTASLTRDAQSAGLRLLHKPVQPAQLKSAILTLTRS